MKIADAAKKVLEGANNPMSARELVVEIEAQGLFKFGAKQPESVLANTLRKKSEFFLKTDSGFILK